MNLDRVTITGADDSTDPQELVRLSKRFPFVEWGILLSASSWPNGSPRFPSLAWLNLLCATPGSRTLKLSGHLCGRWVRDLCAGRATVARDIDQVGFQRIQLNFHAHTHAIRPEAFASALAAWPGAPGFIFQLEGVNDVALDIARSFGLNAWPLFDLSGGAGVLPASWPKLQGGYAGYAGGLSPDNLEQQLPLIAAAADGGRFWIDVETHVRSDNDRLFDMAKVERFLEIAAPHVTA